MASMSEGKPESIVISNIRTANSAILQEVAMLSILTWGIEPTAAEVEKRVRRLEEEFATLVPSKTGIFVARKSGAIVGIVRVRRDKNDASQWRLVGLEVHPAHRRQGIGRSLVNRCIAYARERGAKIIRSAAHLENEASIRFHESVGFNNEGRFTASDGDKKVAFSLPLH
jgi:L-amino acid N-acyltransferase YncA